MSNSSVTPDPQLVRAGYERLVENFIYELIPMKSAPDKIGELPPGSTVSVTCSPAHGIGQTIELAKQIAAAGHRPIPPLAARTVTSHHELRDAIGMLDDLGLTEVFVIAGDAEQPRGPWFDSTEFLTDLLEMAPNLQAVGFGSYPDGHPAIDAERLSAALLAKQALLAEAGVAAHTSTQMCFDPQQLISWLASVRRAGFTAPVRLGVPGAIDRMKLMKMGMRLGVGASLSYLRKNRSSLTKMFTSTGYDPGELIGPMSAHAEALGIEGVHCFTFNNVAATVEWHAGERRALAD